MFIHAIKAEEKIRGQKAKTMCDLGNPFHHLGLSFIISRTKELDQSLETKPL